MATIKQRGTKGWQAQVRIRGFKPLTRTFKTKADAVQWASEREVEMRRGTFVDTTSLRSMTLLDLLQRYLTQVTPSKKGADVEVYRLRALMREPMAKLTLDRVSAAVICDWRETRKSAVKGDTVRREMNLLSSVFSYARSEWQLPVVNPVKGLHRPKQSDGRSRRPSWSELRKVLRELSPRQREDGCWTGARNPWVKPAVLLALRTAMRRGEILGLRWEHINWPALYVHLPATKNGSARDVPLGGKAMLVLRRLASGQKSGPVFPTTASAFKQVFADAMARTGIQNLRFHDFRHEATTRIAEKLANVLELSAVTGHKDMRMLKRYYNPTPAVLAQKLD